MGFREREKERLVPLKKDLFSARACKTGTYRRKRYDFCLHNECASENLHGHIREDALRYFEKRNIPWHDGIGGGPSNHLCCSQSACVNFWFPFGHAPEALTAVLRELGYDVAEALPFEADAMPADDEKRYAASSGSACETTWMSAFAAASRRTPSASGDRISRAWTSHSDSSAPTV